MNTTSVSTRTALIVAMLVLDGTLPRSAAALNCQADSDCPASGTCEVTAYDTCQGSDPDCKPGSACGDKPTMPNQPGCAPYLEGICRQPHELPCQRDEDCGPGFLCREQIGMWCRGWGNANTGEYFEECGVSRGTFACELVEQVCSANADCVSGLQCQDTGTSSSCSYRVHSQAVADGGVSPVPCRDLPPKLCAPEGFFPDWAEIGRDVISGNDGQAADGGSSANVESPNVNTGDQPSGDVVPAALDAEQHRAPEAEHGCSVALRGGEQAPVDLSWLAIAAGMAGYARRQRRR